MPALFIFLFKVNMALLLFCLGYYLVLKHLTFYTLNRIYLVAAIIFSTIYPQINLSDFAQRHQQLTGPVQTVILNWKTPAENFVKPLYQPDYWQWVSLTFWAGVALLAGRLMMQLFSLYKLYRGSIPGYIRNYPVRIVRENVSPFSFWKSIYINPGNLSPADLEGVLEHEQVHVRQWHTLDILLAELGTIFYWFNPGIWLMKKAVRENVEFITDRKILQKGIDSKQYQYSLVNISFAATPNTIVNHFNISTIKKRIIMMNTKRSAGYNLTRYVFLVPAVVALLLVFSLSKAAITKSSLHKVISAVVSDITISAKPTAAVIKSSMIKNTPGKPHAINADTIYHGKGKSKDGRDKSFMMTSDQKADSINYVLNGVKSSKTEVKALDAGKVESLELVPADKAKEFYPELDNSHDILFVTTDDSETGKKLKEKMDKTLGFGKLAGRKNISVARVRKSSDTPVAEGADVTIIDDAKDNAPITKAKGLTIISDNADADPIVLNSIGEGVSTSVTVVARPKVRALTTTKNMSITIDPKQTIILQDGDDAASSVREFTSSEVNKQLKSNITYAYSTNSDKAYRIKFRNNEEASIDNISNKLILINGKQATDKEMKALKITDIKSMTEKTDAGTKEKYGDKAKNGVLFITTKKGG